MTSFRIASRSSCALRKAVVLTLTACTASSSTWRALFAEANTEGRGSPPAPLPLLPPAAASSAIVDCTNAQARVRVCARAFGAAADSEKAVVVGEGGGGLPARAQWRPATATGARKKAPL